MDIFHPQTKTHFRERNQMLQESLRPGDAPFAIEDEYPLVLAEAQAAFSYCLSREDRIVAHANLFPRQLSTETGCHPIGLIGNVATDAAYRGQGIMQDLLGRLVQQATQQGLEALVLWSDLKKFYQKRGFTSHGREWRFFFEGGNFRPARPPTSALEHVPASRMSPELTRRLLELRHPVSASLDRSAQEFVTLLQIPATDLFLWRGGDTVEGFLVLGRGYDMAGVVHEWGVPDPSFLLEGLFHLRQWLQVPQLILLTPDHLDSNWHEALQNNAAQAEAHPMALARALNKTSPVTRALDHGFIWGLDSI